MRKNLALRDRSPDAVRLYYLAQVVFGLGLLGLGTLYYMFMVPEETEHSVDCEICNRARCLGISISKVEIK